MGWQDDALVKGKPKWESDPIIALAGSKPGTLTALDIRVGNTMPQLWPPSINPYSAGHYPLGRNFTVGDEAVFEKNDLLTGAAITLVRSRVTHVDVENDRVKFNQGKHVTDLMGNTLRKKGDVFDVPQQWVPNELFVGKRWATAFQRSEEGQGETSFVQVDMRVARRETIRVPAGSFDTFAVEGSGWNTTLGTQLEVRLWLIPSLNWHVKMEQVRKKPRGKFGRAERFELVSLYQQKFG